MNYPIGQTEQKAEGLVFTSPGYYVCGEQEWKDIEVNATFLYTGKEFGVSPRIYEPNYYMEVRFFNSENQGYAHFDIILQNERTSLGMMELPVFTNKEYKVRIVMQNTTFAVFLDERKVFHIEYPYISNGKVGLLGDVGTTCTNLEVIGLLPDMLNYNVSASHMLGKGQGNAPYLRSSGDGEFYNISVTIAKKGNYVLSFNSKGSSAITVEGATPATLNPSSLVDTKFSYVLTTSTDNQVVKITFKNAGTPFEMRNLQLEADRETSFIPTLDKPNTRAGSKITFPSKNNIEPLEGTFSTFLNPKVVTAFTVFECDKMHLYYEAGKFTFVYGTENVSTASAFTLNTWKHVAVSWSQYELTIFVDGKRIVGAKTQTIPALKSSISIGSGSKGTFSGKIDDVLITSGVLDTKELTLLSTSDKPFVPSSPIILRSSFDAMISNQRQDFIDITPVPKYGSPILAEKITGEPMRKVSFFDPVSGQYRTYNEEVFVYDGFSDYIEIAFDDIETESHKPFITTLDNIRVGEPYDIQGRRIYMNLVPEEKKKLKRKMLRVTYQPKDTYNVDFNIDMYDTARVRFGKVDGNPITITQEGNRFQEEKLLTMIDMNPFATPQHEGFLYVTNNVEKLESFRTHVTPDGIAADYSQALVVVEPLDKYGNPITHLDLDVKAEKGYIVPVYERSSLKMKEQSGRYLYHYYAPFLRTEDVGKKYVEDVINIIDLETGIGVQEHIVLSTSETVDHIVTRFDSVESLCDEYGTAKEDIERENKMKVPLETFLTTNRGQSIKIPISYRASQLEKERTWIEQEVKIGAFVNTLISFFGETELSTEPELFNILNVNGDGIIDYDDFSWIEEHKYDAVFVKKQQDLAAYILKKGGKL
ncbi:virion structural protein_gp082 [Bacillus phage vB_BceM_WH1]|nr:virion structural protein_gp082 [Bacillus phage vB_BceM_WH1]